VWCVQLGPVGKQEEGGLSGDLTRLVLRTANGSSGKPAEIIEFEAFNPPTDFCLHVLGLVIVCYVR
jgi:hypothetical protein